jgi:hypothetical protein
LLVTGLMAHGREAGTPDATAARRSISRFLVELGYGVEEHPFSFNAGVYRALPATGAILAVAALLETPLLLPPAPPWAAAVALLVLAATIAVVAIRLARGDGGSGYRRLDANLIASRPGAAVKVWLVAHLDTKAQAQSMAGRLVTIWITAVAVAVLVAMALVRLDHAVPAPMAIATGMVGALAGLLLTGGRLSGSSPGARDNASGLLAVLTAAELSTDASIGIVVTGAEEFGLVGARAVARERPELFRDASIMNVDTVDDEGTLFVVTHDQKSRALAGRVLDRLAGLAPVSRERRLPLGIMVDSLPLARVAADAVTVGRLTWGTLKRIHTPWDDARGYHLVTAERLGERLARPI